MLLSPKSGKEKHFCLFTVILGGNFFLLKNKFLNYIRISVRVNICDQFLDMFVVRLMVVAVPALHVLTGDVGSLCSRGCVLGLWIAQLQSLTS